MGLRRGWVNGVGWLHWEVDAPVIVVAKTGERLPVPSNDPPPYLKHAEASRFLLERGKFLYRLGRRMPVPAAEKNRSSGPHEFQEEFQGGQVETLPSVHVPLEAQGIFAAAYQMYGLGQGLVLD